MIQIDMEMPKTCYECLLSQNCFGTLICDVTKKRANKHNCPLKEVNECKAEDCISRTDALHCLTGQIELSPSDMPALKAYLDYVNKRINDLPSVYPKSDKSVLDVDKFIKDLKAFKEKKPYIDVIRIDDLILSLEKRSIVGENTNGSN